jgi:hypothetical protein
MNIEALLQAATESGETDICPDCEWDRHLVPTTGRCVDCEIAAEQFRIMQAEAINY